MRGKNDLEEILELEPQPLEQLAACLGVGMEPPAVDELRQMSAVQAQPLGPSILAQPTLGQFSSQPFMSETNLHKLPEYFDETFKSRVHFRFQKVLANVGRGLGEVD